MEAVPDPAVAAVAAGPARNNLPERPVRRCLFSVDRKAYEPEGAMRTRAVCALLCFSLFGCSVAEIRSAGNDPVRERIEITLQGRP